MERYQRQILIPQIGEEGQRLLAAARVTVIGAGGLGCPVLTYLAEAGVGHIRCLDDDVISRSNLNRQFLHQEQGIGQYKADSAKAALGQMNPSVEVEAVRARVTAENAEELLKGAQVVVDCVDNIAARLCVNKACLKQRIPLVEGGISGFYGFATVIVQDSACLECMGYHEGMDGQTVPALGAAAGVIGSLMANECLKLILGAGQPLYGRMLMYDGLSGVFDEIQVKKSETCRAHRLAEKEAEEKQE